MGAKFSSLASPIMIVAAFRYFIMLSNARHTHGIQCLIKYSGINKHDSENIRQFQCNTVISDNRVPDIKELYLFIQRIIMLFGTSKKNENIMCLHKVKCYALDK